ncbi:MFS transporter [Streptomyces sp. ISL-12]|uniref:MFS transporter n=1 Tax=Streptomyces sp. ISL-12 TaxID=2819177 RepID=UPI001BE6A7D8|nr:MFS transporter [Streptomyces sp. ISL-12]MBT2413695.1 MFS transporter [Streptomyces sp. ISL-12]
MPLPLFALLVCVFGVGTAEYVIAGLLPQVGSDLSVTVSSAGLLVTAYALGVVFGGPLLTALTTRFDRKRLMIALMAVFTAGNLLAAVAPGYGVLMVARVVSALAHATLFAVAVVVAVGSVPAEKQGRAVAQVAAGLNLATVLGVPLGTLLGEHYGWRSTFWAVSAVAVIGILLIVALVPATHTGGGAPASNLRDEVAALGRPQVALAIVMTVLGQTGAFTAYTYLATMLTDATGFSTGVVTALLLVYGVGSLAGNLLGGRLADRSLMPSLCGMLIALPVSLVLLGLTLESKAVVPVTVFVFGAAAFAITPALQARLLGAASGAPTLALSVNISAFQIANALGSWLGGVVIDSTLGMDGVSWIAALVSLLALPVALYAMRSDRRGERAATGDAVPAEQAGAAS